MAADLRTEMVGTSYLVLPNREPRYAGVFDAAGQHV
jgi:hypothetical protein